MPHETNIIKMRSRKQGGNVFPYLLVLQLIYILIHFSADAAFLQDPNDNVGINGPQKNFPTRSSRIIRSAIDSEAISSWISRSRRDPFFKQYLTEGEVSSALDSEYRLVAHPITMPSHILRKGLNCSGLNVPLHVNHVTESIQLRPEWLHKSRKIGDCPTQYVSRDLGGKHTPSSILEAVCSCEGSTCSEEGHQCHPVSKLVPVWVYHSHNQHVLDLIEVAFACACVRRPGFGGNVIHSPAIYYNND